MATVTVINGDYSLLASALQPLVERGLFSAISYDSLSNKIIFRVPGRELMTLTPESSQSSNITITFQFDDGTVIEKTRSIGNFGTVYICSGGAYISSVGTSGVYGAFFISKTNRNKAGVAFTSTNSGGSQTTTTRRSLYVWSADDDPDSADVIRVFSPKNGIQNQWFSYCLPTSASPKNSPSYFPDILVDVRSPMSITNTNDETVYIGDRRYLYPARGYYLIADEEE